MKTPTLFLVAIATPILLCASALLPSYAGIFGACYVIYIPQAGPHPMADKAADVFYIVETYEKLFEYWSQNKAALSFVDYTLPIFGLPILGFGLALWLTFRIARSLFNTFHLHGSVN